MKVIILDYEEAEVRIIDIDTSQSKDKINIGSEEIEDILTKEPYNYTASSIEWMTCEEVKLRID